MLALYRKQLAELLVAPSAAAGPAGTAPAKKKAGRSAGHGGSVPAHGLAGVVMEIFHMRLMQPAVEQCLNKAIYKQDTDTTRLLREIDAAAEKAVTAVSGDAAVSRVLLLTVTGLVQAVRCRRLSLFEAEEDLKKACRLLTRDRQPA
jgi:hypothetical protein